MYLCLLFMSVNGCYLSFFSTNTKPYIDPATATKLQTQNRYFVVHFEDSIRGLKQVYISGDTLYGTITMLPLEHAKYLHPDSGAQKTRVKSKDKKTALIEAHLYTNATFSKDDSLFAAKLTTFYRSDVYEFNKSATRTNHILSTVGIITTSVTVVALVIAAAVSSMDISTSSGSTSGGSSGGDCNCPQVYLNEQGEYNFVSGLYSGAVYSTLERTDYLPLKSVAADAQNLSFKISNEPGEEQFINTVQLLQVNHPAGEIVLPDRHGNMLAYTQINAPLTVSAGTATDVKKLLIHTDEQYYSFDNNANENGFSDLVLTFNKPEHADKAKLMIHARNTQWGGLLHKDFLSLFGDSYEAWRTKQEKANPDELSKWQTDQALPLMVYIKTKEGWKFIDYFSIIGNTASRDMIMEINTAGISSDKIEIKLETAYRFWDLDLAGTDYSTNSNYKTKILQPFIAAKTGSTDQQPILKESDNQYTHLAGEEAISFEYKLVPDTTENFTSSYFIISGGYYHTLDKYAGKPNYAELYKFKNKGAFDKFSREKYQQVEEINALLVQKTHQ